MFFSKSKPKSKFRIKREILNSGEINAIPEFKQSFNDSWRQIIVAYGRYYLIELGSVGLSEQDCLDHIDGYKKQLLEDSANKIKKTEFIEIEDKEEKLPNFKHTPPPPSFPSDRFERGSLA